MAKQKSAPIVAEVLESAEVKSLSKNILKNKKYIIIITIIAVVALTPSVYLYNQYQSTKNLLQNPKEQVSRETKDLVLSVGKLIELPGAEQPKIATVTDITQLASQPFFARAKNGDKVLIFAQAGKAILYRASENKIIEVAPVNANIASQTQTNVISPTQAPVLQQFSLTILNGTLTSGLAKTAETKIKSGLANVSSVVTADSLSGNYGSTVVVDVSGKNLENASQLAKLLNAKVETQVPAGEKQPTTDILIILGADFTK